MKTHCSNQPPFHQSQTFWHLHHKQLSKPVYLTTFLAGYIHAVNFLPQLEPIHVVEKWNYKVKSWQLPVYVFFSFICTTFWSLQNKRNHSELAWLGSESHFWAATKLRQPLPHTPKCIQYLSSERRKQDRNSYEWWKNFSLYQVLVERSIVRCVTKAPSITFAQVVYYENHALM